MSNYCSECESRLCNHGNCPECAPCARCDRESRDDDYSYEEEPTNAQETTNGEIP